MIHIVRNTWKGKLTTLKIILFICFFVILRIILAAVAVNIADPELEQYGAGNLLPIHQQDLIFFITILPISVLFYVGCWRSSKNIKSDAFKISLRVILGWILLGHLNEVYMYIETVFFVV
jgi:hypothetical protein